MLRIAFKVLSIACVAFGLGSNLYAQGDFIYTNNDVFPANSVSAFAVAANGVLNQIPGSPFPTMGVGGSNLFSSNRLTVTTAANFLFVSNGGNNSVSVFSINPVTGGLTLVSGSPFATGGSASQGLSLVVTPDARFLMAANSESRDITVFGIAGNGALTAIGNRIAVPPCQAV